MNSILERRRQSPSPRAAGGRELPSGLELDVSTDYESTSVTSAVLRVAAGEARQAPAAAQSASKPRSAPSAIQMLQRNMAILRLAIREKDEIIAGLRRDLEVADSVSSRHPASDPDADAKARPQGAHTRGDTIGSDAGFAVHTPGIEHPKQSRTPRHPPMASPLRSYRNTTPGRIASSSNSGGSSGVLDFEHALSLAQEELGRLQRQTAQSKAAEARLQADVVGLQDRVLQALGSAEELAGEAAAAHQALRGQEAALQRCYCLLESVYKAPPRVGDVVAVLRSPASGTPAFAGDGESDVAASGSSSDSDGLQIGVVVSCPEQAPIGEGPGISSDSSTEPPAAPALYRVQMLNPTPASTHPATLPVREVPQEGLLVLYRYVAEEAIPFDGVAAIRPESAAGSAAGGAGREATRLSDISAAALAQAASGGSHTGSTCLLPPCSGAMGSGAAAAPALPGAPAAPAAAPLAGGARHGSSSPGAGEYEDEAFEASEEASEGKAAEADAAHHVQDVAGRSGGRTSTAIAGGAVTAVAPSGQPHRAAAAAGSDSTVSPYRPAVMAALFDAYWVLQQENAALRQALEQRDFC